MLAVLSKSSVLGLLLVGVLFFTGCASTPWYKKASDHYGQTYRTREFPSETDVFIGPAFDLIRNSVLESVWVGLQKEAEAPSIVLKVQSSLFNGKGKPFQQASANNKALDFTHLSVGMSVTLHLDVSSTTTTVERFLIRIPLNIANHAACDSEDFVIQLAGKDKEPYDIVLPSAMLKGFLGKVKKSGEEGIEGACFDEYE